MQTTCFRLFFSCVLLATSIAQAAPEIPILSGRVVDAAEILSASTEAQLSQELASHEASTSNQVVVLTVPDLQGYDLSTFAIEVARQWQLGQQELDNGVLLLIAKDERKIRIEVGYGLEGDLTDAQSKRIIGSVIRPAFKTGNFDRGVLFGVEAITGTIDGSYTPPQRGEGGKNNLSSPLIPMGIMGIFGLGHFLQGRIHRKYISGMMGATFGGAFAGLATHTWYFALLGALVFGAFLYNSRSKNRPRGKGSNSNHDRHGDRSYSRGRFGSRGGGFSGGGGGFGGGGASGGW